MLWTCPRARESCPKPARGAARVPSPRRGLLFPHKTVRPHPSLPHGSVPAIVPEPPQHKSLTSMVPHHTSAKPATSSGKILTLGTRSAIPHSNPKRTFHNCQLCAIFRPSGRPREDNFHTAGGVARPEGWVRSAADNSGSKRHGSPTRACSVKPSLPDQSTRQGPMRCSQAIEPRRVEASLRQPYDWI
jgi:hypothetical protein